MIGEAVHPTETAGDGRRIEQSLSIKPTDRPDRHIQCAQCGFQVDLDKRATGDSLGAIGTPTARSQTVNPPKPGVSFTDQFADPVDTNTGCPFCNSLNPTGQLRNKLWGSGVNLENA